VVVCDDSRTGEPTLGHARPRADRQVVVVTGACSS
jgi:hypothetical protein